MSVTVLIAPNMPSDVGFGVSLAEISLAYEFSIFFI
jgi:hypothetical protein